MRAGSYGGCGKIRILASRGPGARWGSSASRSGASCTVSADAHGSLRPEPILPEILGTVPGCTISDVSLSSPRTIPQQLNIH